MRGRSRGFLAPVVAGIAAGLLPLAVLNWATAGMVTVSVGPDLPLASPTLDVSSGEAPGPNPPLVQGAVSTPLPANPWNHGYLSGNPGLLATRVTEAKNRAASPARPPESSADDASVAEATAAALAPLTNLPPVQFPSTARAGGAVVTTSRGSDRLSPAVPESISRWEASILKWSDAYGVDPNLVAALMMTESEGNPDALSPKGAVGLMQVLGGATDPDENIREGVEILATNIRRFGRIDHALAAYNAGPGEVVKYGGIPPFNETRNHVFRVLVRLEFYEKSLTGD